MDGFGEVFFLSLVCILNGCILLGFISLFFSLSFTFYGVQFLGLNFLKFRSVDVGNILFIVVVIYFFFRLRGWSFFYFVSLSLVGKFYAFLISFILFDYFANFMESFKVSFSFD